MNGNTGKTICIACHEECSPLHQCKRNPACIYCDECYIKTINHGSIPCEHPECIEQSCSIYTDLKFRKTILMKWFYKMRKPCKICPNEECDYVIFHSDILKNKSGFKTATCKRCGTVACLDNRCRIEDHKYSELCSKTSVNIITVSCPTCKEMIMITDGKTDGKTDWKTCECTNCKQNICLEKRCQIVDNHFHSEYCSIGSIIPSIKSPIKTKISIFFNTKRCPNCKCNIQKGNGCPTMNCCCGFSFCWKCKGATENNINTKKRKCYCITDSSSITFEASMWATLIAIGIVSIPVVVVGGIIFIPYYSLKKISSFKR